MLIQQRCFASMRFFFLIAFIFLISPRITAFESQNFSADAVQPMPNEILTLKTAKGSFVVKSTTVGNGHRYILLQTSGGKTFHFMYTSGRHLNRFWISGVPDKQRRIEGEEQELLRLYLLESGPYLSESSAEAFKVISALAYFFPAGELILPFDSVTDIPRAGNPAQWTMICDFVGKPHDAAYSVGTETRKSLAVVGDVDRECPGRCGIGCYQWGQSRKNQYTQECFNHDLCYAETGSAFGPCRDEYWTAYIGYSEAPDCI